MTISTSEAIVGIYLCCATADGVATAQESMRIVNFTSRSKFFAELGPDGLNTTLDKLKNYITGVGANAAIDLFATVIPANIKLSVYANACDLIMSDGKVEAAELDVAKKIQATLGIDKENADAIVKVIALKNAI